MGKDLALTRGQGRNLRCDRCQFGVHLTGLGVLLLGAGYRCQQMLVAHGFGQEIDGTGLHRAYRRWNIALSAEENDWPMRSAYGQCLLELYTVEAGQCAGHCRPTLTLA